VVLFLYFVVKVIEIVEPSFFLCSGDFDLKYKEGIQQYQPSVSYAPVEREVVQKPPVVIETIRKHIKEEIQPVVYREVLQQELIRETKPIYEKIVEAPSLVRVQAQPVYEMRTLQESLPQVTTTAPIGTTTTGTTTHVPMGTTTATYAPMGTTTTYAPMGTATTTTPVGVTSSNMGGTTSTLPGGGLRETKVTLTETQRGSSSHWNTASS
jgi:hypothetical protein